MPKVEITLSYPGSLMEDARDVDRALRDAGYHTVHDQFDRTPYMFQGPMEHPGAISDSLGSSASQAVIILDHDSMSREFQPREIRAIAAELSRRRTRPIVLARVGTAIPPELDDAIVTYFDQSAVAAIRRAMNLHRPAPARPDDDEIEWTRYHSAPDPYPVVPRVDVHEHFAASTGNVGSRAWEILSSLSEEEQSTSFGETMHGLSWQPDCCVGDEGLDDASRAALEELEASGEVSIERTIVADGYQQRAEKWTVKKLS